MTITTLSSREFNQDVTSAKKAAEKGPVYITNRGRREHVLLDIKTYQALTQKKRNIIDSLAMPENNIDFDPPNITIKPTLPDLS